MARLDTDRHLYLDAAATTPTCPRVQTALLECLAADPGQQRELAAAARARLEATLRAAEVVVTASGTAANNLALQVLADRGARRDRRHVISQPTEHPSVLRALERLAVTGFDVELLPVSDEGRVSADTVRAALRADTAFVSIMRANHETGALQPTEAIGARCREAGVPLHVDAIQALRWLPDSLETLGADLITASAHKLDGPKGIGLLAARDPLPIAVEETAPPAALVALATALELRRAVGPRDAAEVAASRDALQAQLLSAVPGLRVNGLGPRLPGHLDLSAPGVSGEALVVSLDQAGIAASSGAACASGTPGPSPVLLALGRSRAEATGSLRLSLPAALGAADRDRIARALAEAIVRLRSLAG